MMTFIYGLESLKNDSIPKVVVFLIKHWAKLSLRNTSVRRLKHKRYLSFESSGCLIATGNFGDSKIYLEDLDNYAVPSSLPTVLAGQSKKCPVPASSSIEKLL